MNSSQIVCEIPDCATTNADIEAELKAFLIGFCSICKKDRNGTLCGCAFPCSLTFRAQMLNKILQLLGLEKQPNQRAIQVCFKHPDLLKQARESCMLMRKENVKSNFTGGFGGTNQTLNRQNMANNCGFGGSNLTSSRSNNSSRICSFEGPNLASKHQNNVPATLSDNKALNKIKRKRGRPKKELDKGILEMKQARIAFNEENDVQAPETTTKTDTTHLGEQNFISSAPEVTDDSSHNVPDFSREDPLEKELEKFFFESEESFIEIRTKENENEILKDRIFHVQFCDYGRNFLRCEIGKLIGKSRKKIFENGGEEEKTILDVRIFCQNSEEIFETNSFLLGAISPFLRKILSQNSDAEKTILILPDVSKASLTCFFSAIFEEEEISNFGINEMKRIREIAKVFQISSFLTEEDENDDQANCDLENMPRRKKQQKSSKENEEEGLQHGLMQETHHQNGQVQETQQQHGQVQETQHHQHGLMLEAHHQHGQVQETQQHGQVQETQHHQHGHVLETQHQHGQVQEKQQQHGLVQETQQQHGLVQETQQERGQVQETQHHQHGLVQETQERGQLQESQHHQNGLVQETQQQQHGILQETQQEQQHDLVRKNQKQQQQQKQFQKPDLTPQKHLEQHKSKNNDKMCEPENVFEDDDGYIKMDMELPMQDKEKNYNMKFTEENEKKLVEKDDTFSEESFIANSLLMSEMDQ